MNLKDRFINALGGEVKTTNAISRGNDFLKYGNRGNLKPSWATVELDKEDMYRGYAYAVIQKRGNKVATLAKENLKTWANPETIDEYQKHKATPTHPYLKVIENSRRFTEKQFWKTISIYLDLAGRYYLGVIRNHVKSQREGLPDITTDVQDFVLLNPFLVSRVLNEDGEVGGYIERHPDGKRERLWPIQQIIEIKELNPFDNRSQWSLAQAAKQTVYTMNQSSDYTRHTLNGNLDSPGIISTDVILPDTDFENFTSRILQHTKGEPLFANGAGGITWNPMQVDLDKAALTDINEINRTELFAVSGTSKTALGIEQSGTTRETARVQNENFVSDTAQPRLEDIVDFLNLDYKQYYPREYAQTGYYIGVESAVGKDYDTDTKAANLRQKEFEIAEDLKLKGYTEESAVQYALGEIDLSDLEVDKEKRETYEKSLQGDDDEDADNGDGSSSGDGGNPNDGGNPATPSVENTIEEVVENDLDSVELQEFYDYEDDIPEPDHSHDLESVETFDNELGDSSEEFRKAYNELLKEIRSVQRKTIKTVINKINKNSFTEEDIISEEDKESLTKRLKNALKKYWWVILPLVANRLINRRNQEFKTKESFDFTKELQDMILANAQQVAEGHMHTILDDVLEASNKTYTREMENAAAKLIQQAYDENPSKYQEWFAKRPTLKEIKRAIQNSDILDKNKRIYDRANKMALEGKSMAEISKAIRHEYSDLSTKRADLIARNETSRAFTHSQYEADLQFLKNTGRLDTAYKQWFSRSGNPCEFCQALIDKGPIPFTENFIEKGDGMEITVDGKVKTFNCNYETIQGGCLHPNCECRYELVFKNADGEFVKTLNSEEVDD